MQTDDLKYLTFKTWERALREYEALIGGLWSGKRVGDVELTNVVSRLEAAHEKFLAAYPITAWPGTLI